MHYGTQILYYMSMLDLNPETLNLRPNTFLATTSPWCTQQYIFKYKLVNTAIKRKLSKTPMLLGLMGKRATQQQQ